MGGVNEAEHRRVQGECRNLEQELARLRAVPATLPGPFRLVDFSVGEHTRLVRRIASFKPRIAKVPVLNMLLYGHIGAGKSAFIRTVDSPFQGCISRIVAVGAGMAHNDRTGNTTVTRILRKIRIEPDVNEVQDMTETPLCIWDSMGKGEASREYSELEISLLLDGALPNGCQLDTLQATEMINNTPGIHERVHVAVAVISASQITDPEIVLLLSEFVAQARAKHLNCLVLLTGCDRLDATLVEHPENLFISPAVKEACEAVERSGIAESDVFPIINYSRQVDRDIRIEIPVLRFVECAMQTANATLKTWASLGLHGAS